MIIILIVLFLIISFILWTCCKVSSSISELEENNEIEKIINTLKNN